MDYIEFFTEAINEYRIQNNLNISQFAERLGVSEQCVSNWLTRHNGPSLELLISVANLLNCSLDYLVGRSQSPEYVPADNGFIFNERLSLLLKNNNLSAFKLAKACGFGDSIFAKFRILPLFFPSRNISMFPSIISSEGRIPYKYFYRYSQTDLQIYVKSSMQPPCTFFVFPINNIVNYE